MSNSSDKSILRLIKEYILVAIGITIYVLGWVVFLIPNNLVGGGVTGIGTILQYATGFNVGYTFFIINGILLIIAFFVMGAGFGGKTIMAIILASIGLRVLPELVPETIIQAIALDNGKLMCTLIGAIMAGLGIGMAMSQGGSTGGTDIIALIVSKYRNVSPGRMILLIDVVIIASSFFVPSYTADGELVGWADKFTGVVYGLLLVTVCGNVIDIYLSGTKQSVQVFILSHKYAEIADCITTNLHRGVTVMPAQGWYTKEESHVLMVISRKSDLNIMLRYIKSIDPDAFLSVATTTGVYGRGFDTIKTKAKKVSEKIG
ncbi:MAG: YitT family protein [Bacteroidales bacterium]|nr:YitT family protein [Bacteroidales bacterium]MBQ8461245.1 YitT family protein [Bacteroidales bacterium]